MSTVCQKIYLLSHYIFVVYQETWYQHWLTWWVQWTMTKPKNVSSVNRSCLSFYRGIRMTWGQIFIQAQVIKRVLPQPTVFYFIWCRYSVLVDITYVQITTRWFFSYQCDCKDNADTYIWYTIVCITMVKKEIW